jgi:asparagine synthase (glutamine-hydrolysing)
MPGHFAKVSPGNLEIQEYYSIPKEGSGTKYTYDQAKEKLSSLLEESVKKRLVADVPLGAFLSGGIDSSVVTALASKHKADLHTFSIGFKDEKFFDETEYATLVAKQFKTEHTVFSLTNDDLFKYVHSILDYIDEPFADSSAIAVYILSQETRKHATVALSGDGADELLGGYNKHAAFYQTLHPGGKEKLVAALRPIWKALPKSRNNFIGNRFRQLDRFGEGMRLSPQERYWRWAGYATETTTHKLLSETSLQELDKTIYGQRKSEILKNISSHPSMNDILYTDLQLVLPNDMLTKVDLMSMANGLEVRVPFLDVDVVNFISSLPDDYKINRTGRKRILQDAFRDILPNELYNRPKKGFEVPLLKWFRNEMKSMIADDLLSEKLISAQGIFNYTEINKLKKQLFSSNPGDVHARIWGLIVFQSWWKKYLL